MPKKLPGNKLIVAAIDFGSTYSGYAYAFRDSLKTNNLNIYLNKAWIGEGQTTSKVPTVILLEPTGEFHSFGYEAENKYHELVEDNMHNGWHYFRQFKMQLYDKNKITREMEICDQQGKAMPAMTIFSLSIKYMADHMWDRIQPTKMDLEFSDIHWVLTIPSIWTDDAKQFMREASKKAGIESSHLTLAFEPEAAAVFCKEITMQKEGKGNSAYLSTFNVGQRFMLADLGGGTVDITVHEVKDAGKLKELAKSSGGIGGGADVDEAYFKLMKNLFGETVIEKFQNGHTSDQLEIERQFELKKRNITKDGINLTLPLSLFEIYENVNGDSFQNLLPITNSCYAKNITCRAKNKLKVNRSVCEELFLETIRRVISHMRINDEQVCGIKTILMVGGFSESKLVQEMIKSEFSEKSVIFPEDAGLAVMKGAVLYGYDPGAICSRISPYTFGISTCVPFDDKIHPESKRIQNDKCEDIFHRFVELDQVIIPGETSVMHSFHPPKYCSNIAHIEIYKSLNLPMYITDTGCKCIGTLAIHLTESVPRPIIQVKMYFGDTELHVEAKEEDNERPVTANFDFLS